jgi:malonyl-CoA/methylmalonyl-CoA synthetase
VNLHDLFAIPLRRAPRKVALELDGGGRWDYGELFAAAERWAAGLAARGVGRGDRVALHLGNRAETVVAYLAAFRLGAAAVPVNLAYRRREIAHLLGDAEPRLLLTEAAARPVLGELTAADRASVEAVLEVEALTEEWGRPAGDTPRSGPPPAPPVDGGDLALLLYTSGTTGRSKGAMLTHDNLLATVCGLLAAWAWERDDRLLLTLPLFHTHGLVVGLLTALAAGAMVRLARRFDAAAVADALTGRSAGAPTLFFGVPTMYVRLVDELTRRESSGVSPAVRLFASGSAPLAPETFAAFHRLTGHAILERYGMTETGMNLSNPYAGERVAGTVGTPLPGVSARLAGDDGAPVETGGEGELQVTGSHVFAGYWRDAGKTAAAFAADASGRRWFRTGDLARRDPRSGHYTLLGRRHELIITGGYNVYPREVEEALEELPEVAAAAVAGAVDRDKGEVVAAWVVPAAGRDADEEALRRRLDQHLADRLAAFKLPRRFTFVAELPRNPLGKVQKHLLPGR